MRNPRILIWIDSLISNPSKVNLLLLSSVLNRLIPFNTPHGFKLKQIDGEKVVTDAPYKRKNFNHLKGIHACAIATLGEFSAGMALAKLFGLAHYRIILQELKITYHFQALTDLQAECLIPTQKKEKTRQEITELGKTTLSLESYVRDKNKNLVAIVVSQWQLKDWQKVQTKI